MKDNTIIFVARASNSKKDCEHDLYSCLLPRCEALSIPLGISDRNAIIWRKRLTFTGIKLFRLMSQGGSSNILVIDS